MNDIDFIRQYVVPTGIACCLLIIALYIDRRVISDTAKPSKWYFYLGLFALNCVVYVSGRVADNILHGEVYPLIKELIEISVAISALFGAGIMKLYRDKKKDEKQRTYAFLYFTLTFLYRAIVAISPAFLGTVEF